MARLSGFQSRKCDRYYFILLWLVIVCTYLRANILPRRLFFNLFIFGILLVIISFPLLLIPMQQICYLFGQDKIIFKVNGRVIDRNSLPYLTQTQVDAINRHELAERIASRKGETRRKTMVPLDR